MLLKLFTDIPTEEIVSLCQSDIIQAKKRMAYEVTKLVHGEEEAQKAIEAAAALFRGGDNLQDVPSVEFDKHILEQGINVVDLLVQTGFFASKGEAKRMIAQGGVSIDSNKINNIDEQIKVIDKDYTILKKGKKNFLKVIKA